MGQMMTNMQKHLTFLETQDSPQSSKREEELKQADLPTFNGDTDPEIYLDLERRLNNCLIKNN